MASGKDFRTSSKAHLADQNITMFQTALAFHQQGNLSDAKMLYVELLRQNPQHFDALHLSGLIADQSGQIDQAVDFYKRALRIRSDFAPLYLNYANALKRLNRFDEALHKYNDAIQIQRDYADAYNNRGVTLQELGRYEEALRNFDDAISLEQNNARLFYNRGNACKEMKLFEEALDSYDRAIMLQNDYADAFNNRAITLQELRRFEEALESYDITIMLQQDCAEAFNNRSVALQELRRFEDAVHSCEKAISIKADFADAFYNQGNALKELKRWNEALESYDRAISIKADYVEAINNRGVTLQALKRLPEALQSYDKAISVKPHYADAFNNRGNALKDLQRFEEALQSYEQAISIRPDYAEALYNHGNMLANLKRSDEALQSFDKAIAIHPTYANAHWNKGLVSLLSGKFLEGFRLYEWRMSEEEPNGRNIWPQPLWLGDENISGKTIFVHREQGLGDTIQFCRYIPILIEMGAKVLFAPHRPLMKLLSTLNADCKMVDFEDETLQFDYHCPLLSLPLACKTDLATIPNKVPYLGAAPQLVAAWRRRIGEPGFKIGICWQGSLTRVDAGRAFPLRQFAILSGIPGVRLISLHKGEGEAQLNDLPTGMVVETLGDEFDTGPDAFVDTAAVMKCCDLVITCDTAIAHLAGALGVKTWVALPYAPDWRWMLDRDDSPWHPTLRLFRQHSHGDWDGVFQVIKRELLLELARRP
jgi:tetratricopeptide (TPR) repeat protein